MIAHDMDLVFGVAERVILLHYGQIACEGTCDEIRGNQLVKDIYMGSPQGSTAGRGASYDPAPGHPHLVWGQLRSSGRLPGGEDATIVALLGRNGMGKTTTIRSIMGLTPPRKGRHPAQRHRTSWACSHTRSRDWASV